MRGSVPGGGGGLSPGWDGHEAGRRSSPRNELRRECLGSSYTLIFTTHRLELIQLDDSVVCVSGGQVTEDGKFENLKQSSAVFTYTKN